MDLEKSLEAIRTAILQGQAFVVFGRCRVNYRGRSASQLGEGDRILLVKADRSVSLHRPFGYGPVNWQPSGCTLKVDIEEGELVFLAARSRPHERLLVQFSDVFGVHSHKLIDEAEFIMYATEKEMKQAVLLQPQLIEDGFKPLEDEKKAGPAGFIDVFGVDRDGRIVVVELKRGAATAADLGQLHSYLKEVEKEVGREVRGIIAAPSVRKGAAPFLKVYGIEFKCLTPRRAHEILAKEKGLDRFTTGQSN